ncbi:anti-anti-sigma factor [Pseudoroseomonas rhizosphaerae]|uniref:Anti-sigma factor antagonist n=1 Tax=Teichococcus rhizosphaerae TaxID=1335062 RepID=A0A2C7AHN2_9PROT|nr:STAS domain-containing protein [Pseudoroseomonas rhizosphaerae]PHK96736.1 anti-anti-sigma factor [Pseudoroseomonas rhizosphaerae]
MEIVEIEAEGMTVAVLEGRLDTATAPAAEARLLALLAERPVVADLSAVRYVSSAGLRVLLKAAKQGTASGHGFSICGLQSPVREVFEISGFDRIITAYPTRAEALAA